MRFALLLLSALVIPCAALASSATVFPPANCSADEERIITWKDGSSTTYCRTGQEILNMAIHPCKDGEHVVFHETETGRVPVGGESSASGKFVCEPDPEPVGAVIDIPLVPSATMDPSGNGDLLQPLGSNSVSINLTAKGALTLACSAAGSHTLSMGQEAQLVVMPEVDGIQCGFNTAGSDQVWSWLFYSSAACTRLLMPGAHTVGCSVHGERINAPQSAHFEYTVSF